MRKLLILLTVLAVAAIGSVSAKKDKVKAQELLEHVDVSMNVVGALQMAVSPLAIDINIVPGEVGGVQYGEDIDVGVQFEGAGGVIEIYMAGGHFVRRYCGNPCSAPLTL